MPKRAKVSPEEALLVCLQHPLRRALLKLYVEAEAARSPKDLTLPTNGHISTVGYHVRVLAEKGAVELVAEEPRRGSVEHFYEPTALVDEVPWGRALSGCPKLESDIEESLGLSPSRRRRPERVIEQQGGSAMGEKKTHAAKRSGRAASGSKRDRLAPGELNKLVLGYMRRHKKDAPHTASAVAKGIERSSGAVANCLGRQEKKGKVRLVKPKPREYELAQSKKS